MMITPAGEFLDTRFPEIGTDKLVLHFSDPEALLPLRQYAQQIMDRDPDLAHVIGHRLEELHSNTTKEG